MRIVEKLKPNTNGSFLGLSNLAVLLAVLIIFDSFTHVCLLFADEIKNPGFEVNDKGKIENWTLIGPETYFLLDTVDFFEGQYALRISIGNLDEIVSFQQEIDVEASVRYEFAGMLKTQLGESGSLLLFVTFYNIDGKEIESFRFPEIKESQEWTYHKMMIKAPNESDKAVVQFRVKGRGSVWVDDMYFSTMLRGLYGR